MFGDDDEEELELLRQYENQDLAQDDDNKSSDDMDSDLEDKIMSIVQYGSGITKKKAPAPAPTPTKTQDAASSEQSHVQAKVVYAPVDNAATEDSQKAAVSSANIYQIDETESEDDTPSKAVYSDEDDDEEEEEDVGVVEPTTDMPANNKPVEQPQVTRFINLDEEEKRYLDDEDTSEEEAELESKLQQLIDDQIYNRQSKRRFKERPIRVCFNCHTPGHERIDCKLCMDCGMPKHKDPRCVGARYCAKCKLRGHNAIDCTHAKTFDNCRHCGLSYHHSDMCPSLLHTYVGEVAPKTTPVAWCYNCTAKGHYGDECPDLPQYKTSLPSVFSKWSLGLGSRFDPKKTKKASSASSSSYHHGSTHTANTHQRWSDSSRESSPRYDHRDTRKRPRYGHNDSEDDYNSRYTRRDNGPSSSMNSNNKNSSKKRQKTNNQPGLDGFFSHQLPPASSSRNNNNNTQNNNNSRSGNNNWKAMNNNSLPQPTRSGTVKVNSYSSRQQRQDYGDFPRGNNDSSHLPRPSASGVIDLTGDSTSSNSSNRGGGGGGGGYSSNRRPKYHGGYNRNR